MTTWAQDEIDAVLPDANGIRHYPPETRFAPDCVFAMGASFGEGASFGKGASFGEGCIADTLLWGYLYLPPPTLAIRGRILPPLAARPHWETRLYAAAAIVLPENACYLAIEEAVRPHLEVLRAWPHWLPVERLIVESWIKELSK